MANIFFEKRLVLPSTLTPNTMYLVRKGSGFDFYMSDNAGNEVYPVNGGKAPSVLPPGILSPTNGQANIQKHPTLTASVFGLTGATADTHVASQWQIRLASGDWNSLVYDSGETTDLTSHTVPDGILQDGQTQYVVRVRYKGASLGWSDWSQEVTFTTPQQFYEVLASGGTVTIDGDYKVHTFTSSGTFTLSIAGSDQVAVEYLIVAGGGGGGMTYGGGGGAGGVLTAPGYMLSPGSYAVVVGAGGAGSSDRSVKGANGSNSSFNSITAIGGGGGGSHLNLGGANGGSGGGGAVNTSSGTGGSGTSGQGYAGANGAPSGTGDGGGGGGGAGGPGNYYTTTPSVKAGNGGPGIASSITGTSVMYAAGGGGGANSAYQAGSGGSGIGGNGTNASVNAYPGAANTGSGGGGSGYSGSYTGSGGAGGSGIVIIRYRYQ